jgi:hypothetical protein
LNGVEDGKDEKQIIGGRGATQDRSGTGRKADRESNQRDRFVGETVAFQPPALAMPWARHNHGPGCSRPAARAMIATGQ